MAYKVIDVANYIISYCKKKGIMLTNIQAQKILYYIQAAFLVNNDGHQAFEEDICAWRYGPVVQEVYDELKRYGSRPIVDVIHQTRYEMQNGKIIVNKCNDDPYDIIDDSDKSLINRVIDKQLTYSTFELVERTHEELPWKITINSGRDYIDPNIIKAYFNVNKGRIYG